MRLRSWFRRIPGLNRRWIKKEAERASQQAVVVSRLPKPQVDGRHLRRETDQSERPSETTSLALREP
jgi:hypothetical protein